MAVDVMTRLDPNSRAAARGLSDLTIRNLFIIPTIAFLIIFNIFPLLYSLGYSFTDFRASTNAPANWIGLQNYRELLNDDFIWRNFTITAKYVLISVSGQVVVGFGMAMLLNREIPAKGLITTLLLRERDQTGPTASPDRWWPAWAARPMRRRQEPSQSSPARTCWRAHRG